jgi:DNA-binding response OmpR family regulator/signal transduction histidine kinase
MKVQLYLLSFIFVFLGLQNVDCQVNQFDISQIQSSYDLNGQVYVLSGGADRLPMESQGKHWLPLADYLAQFRMQASGGNGVKSPGFYWCRIALSNRMPEGFSIGDWQLVSLGDEIAEVHCAASSAREDVRGAQFGIPSYSGECPLVHLQRRINGIRLDIPSKSSVLLYMKIKTGISGVPAADFELRSISSFAEKSSGYVLRYDHLILGFLLAHCFLCYVLFLGSNDRVFLYLFLFQAGIVIYLLNNFGLFSHSDWLQQHPTLLQVGLYAVVIGLEVSYLQFVRQFMNFKRVEPKADRALKGLIWLSTLLFIAVVAGYMTGGDKELADKIIIVFSILAFGVPMILLMKVGRGSLRGLFVVTGTAFALLGALINGISVILGLGERALVTYSVLMGETFFFSLGLAYHVKMLVLRWQRGQRQREREEMKAGLYFEITNEFRTPLTIIQGVASQLREALSRPEELEKLDRIISNGNYLLRLAGRINALANVHSGQQQLDFRRGDIMQFLRYWVFSFQPMAMEKDVRIRFLTEMEEFEMDFDAEKLQDVVTNLVTSSIRFARVGSELSILAKAVPGRKGKQEFMLQIKNAGSAITQEKLERAFGKREVRGNMYGNFLAMVIMQELLQLMGGSFEVSSERKEMDAVLTLRLPVNRQAAPGRPLELPVPQPEASAVPSDMAFLTEGNLQEEKPLVLVVDSNDDVVQFIRYALEKDYRLITANGGEDGIRKAIEHIPDIVISEIAVPGKNGLELCSTLKADERTSHIPVILMSATATSVQNRIAGLASGASTCLIKPFHQTELVFYLNNLLDAKRSFQAHFQHAEREQEIIAVDFIAEEDFLDKVRQIVEARMDDEQFGVVHLCHKLGMSRSQLHRKIKALTGGSTSALINNLRLDAARRLLLNSDLNVAEVAYRVGLEPNYFSRIFKESTGFTPTDFRNESQHHSGTCK